MHWAGHGSVLAEDVDQNYIHMLSSIKLSHTAPLLLGILESDNHNSSFGQQQIKKLHTIYVYRNIRIIAFMGSKMATSYHGIGSRVKNRRTGIDDQTLTMIFLRQPTPRLTKSLQVVHFQIRSFVPPKFEEPAFGVPTKTFQLAKAEKLTGVELWLY